MFIGILEEEIRQKHNIPAPSPKNFSAHVTLFRIQELLIKYIVEHKEAERLTIFYDLIFSRSF